MQRMYLPYLWAWILAAEVIAELEERVEEDAEKAEESASRQGACFELSKAAERLKSRQQPEACFAGWG
jgi:hypothetical protein